MKTTFTLLALLPIIAFILTKTEFKWGYPILWVLNIYIQLTLFAIYALVTNWKA